MTIQDVDKLLSLLKVNYRAAFDGMEAYEREIMAKSWAIALRDIDADLAFMGTMKVISTSKTMPTVAEIRESVRDMNAEADGKMFDSRAFENSTGQPLIDEREKKMLESIVERTKDLYSSGNAGIGLETMLLGNTSARLENGQVRFMLNEAKEENGQ